MPDDESSNQNERSTTSSTHHVASRNAVAVRASAPVPTTRLASTLARPAVPTAPAAHRDVVGFTPSPAGSAPRSRRFRKIAAFSIMGFAGALVAAMAIPAYAFTPGDNTEFAASQAQVLRNDQAQTVAVAGSVVQAAISRDAFASTAAPVPEPVAAPVETAADTDTEDVEAERAATAETFNEWTGDTAEELVEAAPATSYSLSAVYNTALQYQGVPYVFGGATPAGFDCSGFVMYVFAQYGISMPHSSAGQGAMGTVIPESEAQPGDLVIMDGHDGFYAGNGNILHAPYEGASVRVQPLWTSDYYIVRIAG